MAPLPIRFQTNESVEQGFALMGVMGKNKNANPRQIAEAQAIKDATMAWRIAKNLPSKLFISMVTSILTTMMVLFLISCNTNQEQPIRL